MIFGSSARRNRRKRPERTPRAWLAWIQPLLEGGLRTALGIAGFIAGTSIMLWGLMLALDQPIRRIDAVGQFKRVAPVQIEEVVAPFRGAGFLSVDLKALREAVESIPWIDRVRIERRWPNTLRVAVTEHVAAARWGEDGLMNTRGELFLRGARHIPPELPQLNGPPGTEAQVAKLYLDTYPRLLAVGLRLERVDLDARGAWSLTLANGVEIRLGRQDVQERLERFIRVASPLVAQRSGEVSYVDLRYSNGFSVGWNPSARVAQGLDAAGSGA